MTKAKSTPNAQRQAALAKLREALRLPLLARVVSRSPLDGEDPQFALVLHSGEEIFVGNAEALLSQRRIQALVAGRADRVIPRLKPAEWDQVVQLMLDIHERV